MSDSYSLSVCHYMLAIFLTPVLAPAGDVARLLPIVTSDTLVPPVLQTQLLILSRYFSTLERDEL